MSPKELYTLAQTINAKLEQEARRPDPDLRRLVLSVGVIQALEDRFRGRPEVGETAAAEGIQDPPHTDPACADESDTESEDRDRDSDSDSDSHGSSEPDDADLFDSVLQQLQCYSMPPTPPEKDPPLSRRDELDDDAVALQHADFADLIQMSRPSASEPPPDLGYDTDDSDDLDDDGAPLSPKQPIKISARGFQVEGVDDDALVVESIEENWAPQPQLLPTPPPLLPPKSSARSLSSLMLTLVHTARGR